MTRSVTKTLTIRDEIYRKLLAIKGEGESFSELFDRLAADSSPIEVLKRLRGVIELDDKEKILREIHRRRDERTS